jgi:arabinofuranosyltransferase
LPPIIIAGVTTTERGSPTSRGTDTNQGNRLGSWIFLLIPLLIVIAGAWIYRWVDEDALINFRIIDNLLAGHGPVFNLGERVEAYTSPLWLFTLAGLHVVIPFVTLEWLSVGVGIVATVVGVVLGGRGVQRLGASRRECPVLPLGLLIFASVAATWEFATSGLEMGMAFGWIGLCFWTLVRTENQRKSATLCAFCIGLGPLVRPELVFMSVIFLVGLGVVVAAPNWKGPVAVGRRFVLPLIIALALPVLYELWRMAYFGLLVPNTALAKSGTSSWWSQGFTYLWNFLGPYALWIPLMFGATLVALRAHRWWRHEDLVGVTVLITPIVAGLVDALYVVRLGGDYMHARLLMPGFFSLCLVVYIGGVELRTAVARSLMGGIVAWSVVSIGLLRFDSGPFGAANAQGISNVRDAQISDTGDPHPIDVSSYAHTFGWRLAGLAYKKIADSSERPRLLVITNVYLLLPKGHIVPARSNFRFRLAVNPTAIGETGYLSGSNVYIFDALSLANPIGSHFIVRHHGRVGHEKYVGPVWMLARFGASLDDLPPGSASFVTSGAETSGVSASTTIFAARDALNCDPLRSYLLGITGSLSLHQAWSNLVHSFTYTRMSFDADPVVARQELCRGN